MARQVLAGVGARAAAGDGPAAQTLALMKRFLWKRFHGLPDASLVKLAAAFERWVLAGRSDGRVLYALRRFHRECYLRHVGGGGAQARERARARTRAADIRDVLRAAGAPGGHFPGSPTPTASLDVGCAEGSLTAAIGRALGLPAQAAVGCDVAPAPAPPPVGFTYWRGRAEALPFEDGQFQVVSCIMSLHHFADLDQALSEIRRVLAPGGLVLVREHDCPDAHFAVFLDFVHCFYAAVEGEVTLRGEQADADFDAARGQVVSGRYRSLAEWDAVLRRAGFEPAGQPAHTRDIFRSFYRVYRPNRR